METIKDLWASLVAYAHERGTNPLTSAFMLTWAAWNYKLFIVLFSDETSFKKFDAIAELYPRSDERCLLTNALCMPPDAFWGGAFLYPALTTLFYVFAYPFITSWVVTFYRRQQVQIANKLKTVEGERVRTVDEVSQMVRRFENRIKHSEEEANSARQELADTRTALQAAEAEASKYKASAITSVGTGTVSDPVEVQELPLAAGRHPQLMRGRDARGVAVQKTDTWVIENPDDPNSPATITQDQARILHIAMRVKLPSPSDIAVLLKLPLEGVMQDVKELIKIGALKHREDGYFLSNWGRVILEAVNDEGEVDDLNAEYIASWYRKRNETNLGKVVPTGTKSG